MIFILFYKTMPKLFPSYPRNSCPCQSDSNTSQQYTQYNTPNSLIAVTHPWTLSYT